MNAFFNDRVVTTFAHSQDIIQWHGADLAETALDALARHCQLKTEDMQLIRRHHLTKILSYQQRVTGH